MGSAAGEPVLRGLFRPRSRRRADGQSARPRQHDAEHRDRGGQCEGPDPADPALRDRSQSGIRQGPGDHDGSREYLVARGGDPHPARDLYDPRRCADLSGGRAALQEWIAGGAARLGCERQARMVAEPRLRARRDDGGQGAKQGPGAARDAAVRSALFPHQGPAGPQLGAQCRRRYTPSRCRDLSGAAGEATLSPRALRPGLREFAELGSAHRPEPPPAARRKRHRCSSRWSSTSTASARSTA